MMEESERVGIGSARGCGGHNNNQGKTREEEGGEEVAVRTHVDYQSAARVATDRQGV